MKFNEAQLEQAFITLLKEEQIVHQLGNVVRQGASNIMAEPLETYGHLVSDQVLIEEDFKAFLRSQIKLKQLPKMK